jgi:general secretion pathway protein A
MYESYWQLDTPSFENGADPRFYYPSEGHQAALLKLRYAIETRKGAALLAGDHGTGKTMIIEMLRQQLAETCRPFLHLVFPQMSAGDLLAYIAAELAGPEHPAPRTADHSVRLIQQTLAANTMAGRHAVVAIDEAHLIDDPACWETLRLLLNFSTDGRQDLTLVLIGQLPLAAMFARMPAWEERLGVKCILKPLGDDETAGYVRHRLHAAGTPLEIFSPDAAATLHRLSRGFPRRINRLADLALLVGYAEQLDVIQPDAIEAVAAELTALPAA